eukprot:COSAG01_NODE_15707_length_1307_cov_152.555464_2_plen_123_part_00
MLSENSRYFPNKNLISANGPVCDHSTLESQVTMQGHKGLRDPYWQIVPRVLETLDRTRTTYVCTGFINKTLLLMLGEFAPWDIVVIGEAARQHDLCSCATQQFGSDRFLSSQPRLHGCSAHV